MHREINPSSFPEPQSNYSQGVVHAAVAERPPAGDVRRAHSSLLLPNGCLRTARAATRARVRRRHRRQWLVVVVVGR